jgi:hypothetical protein
VAGEAAPVQRGTPLGGTTHLHQSFAELLRVVPRRQLRLQHPAQPSAEQQLSLLFLDATGFLTKFSAASFRRRAMVTKKTCKSKLKNNIKKNLAEKHKWTSTRQAIAVAFAQTRRQNPKCILYIGNKPKKVKLIKA